MATADLLPPPTDTDFSDAVYEVIGDEIREKEMSARAVALANRLSQSLDTAARDLRCGASFVEMLFVIRHQPRLHRCPDVAFVSYERWGSGPPEDANAWDTIPNLAVEIVSPTNFGAEIEEKVVEYLTAGVNEVWILQPKSRRMYVHESLTKVRVVTESDSITWEAMLPGFSLPLAQLFAEMQPPRS